MTADPTPTPEPRTAIYDSSVGDWLRLLIEANRHLSPDYADAARRLIERAEAQARPEQDEAVRAALETWLFPRGLNHPEHWSLTNEGAREIARAALATAPPVPAAPSEEDE